MERIALIWENTYFYWSYLVLTLAAITAGCLFLALYLKDSPTPAAGLLVLPLAAVLSLAAARLLHWYCYAETYPSLQAAMTGFGSGGFALVGVFAGCLAAALITRILCLHRNLPQMLDCMCLSGALGISLGRLSCFFNAADRGQIIQSVRTLPWVYPVINSVSGTAEYRLATFLLQSMATGCLFLVLLLFFLTGKQKRRHGDTALLFALCYSAAEVVLDSTRYDSMYFRSNGFVSIVQVLSALALVSVILLFSCRMVKKRGFHPWYLALWLSMAVLIGGAGYMEYHVQRHGNEALFAYSIMSACLILVVILTLLIYHLSRNPIKKPGRYLA